VQPLLTPVRKRGGPRSLEDGGDGFAINVVEHLGFAAFVLGADGRVLLWNNACERLTGVSAREVVGTSNQWRAFYGERRPCLADLVLSGRFDDIGALYASGGKANLSESGVSAENWCVMPKLGRPLYLAIDASPICDRSGAVIAAVETLRDITVHKQRQIELETMATRDGLTGLSNRRSFDERLPEEARRAAREKLSLSLLMIDIDFFKHYNDADGHQAGDECLRTVAQAISNSLLRAGDFASRYGGDEFAVILPGASQPGATRVVERVLERIADLRVHHSASTVSNNVTLSIGGAAALSFDGGRSEALLACADAALYRAKRDGRNRAVIVPFDGLNGAAREV
jgi:diguanylate cyclase (GGDEF)-like protein